MTSTNRQASPRRAVAVLLTVLVVSAGPISPAGPAVASHGDADCSELDHFVDLINPFEGSRCDPVHLSNKIDQIQAAEDNQTHIDLYEAAASQKAQGQVTRAVFDNYLNDTRSTAWLKAEAVIAEAFENGTTKSVARIRAKAAIEDYYAVKQQNLVESWNVSLKSLQFTHRRAQNESGLAPGNLFTVAYSNDDIGRQTTNISDWNIWYNRTNTLTLVDGTQVTAHVIAYDSSGQTCNTAGGFTGPVEGSDCSKNRLWHVTVHGPDSGFEDLQFINASEYTTRWNRIQTLNEELKTEADAFVNATWADYDSGTINASDVLSRTTLMFEYGTTAASGNGTFFDSLAATATMGLDTPNLNNTGVMEVSYQNATYDGMVFARNAPNGSWQVGRTYDSANITGPVLLATTDGQRLDLTGEFTVTNATTSTGEAKTVVETTEYNYQAANTTRLLTQMDRLLELSQEIESRQATASPGGGFDFDLGSIGTGGIAVIAVAAGAVLLLGRE